MMFFEVFFPSSWTGSRLVEFALRYRRHFAHRPGAHHVEIYLAPFTDQNATTTKAQNQH